MPSAHHGSVAHKAGHKPGTPWCLPPASICYASHCTWYLQGQLQRLLSPTFNARPGTDTGLSPRRKGKTPRVLPIATGSINALLPSFQVPELDSATGQGPRSLKLRPSTPPPCLVAWGQLLLGSQFPQLQDEQPELAAGWLCARLSAC